MELRPYQLRAMRGLAEAFAAGSRHPLVSIACGGGKTVLAAFLCDLIRRKGRRVLFIVHRRELMAQTVATFDRCGIPLGDLVQVEMVKTAANHPERYGQVDAIVIDEAHLSITPTYRKLVEQHPAAYIVGLTATPARLDGRPLAELYDRLIMGPQTAELIEGGFLSPYRYYAPTVADLSALKRKGSDYDLSQATDILSQRAVYGDVISHYRQLADGRKTICYCSSIKHSEAMAEQFRQAGYPAVHFDGETPKAEREDIMRRFRAGELRVLCNVNLVSEGLDVPDCDCCILLRPTMSTALAIQQAGRALRFLPGKTAIIIDHVGNVHRHGLPDTPHDWTLEGRLSAPKSQSAAPVVRTCLKCYSAYDGKLKACPYCQEPAKLTEREIKELKEVRLQEIRAAADQKVEQITNPDHCRNLQELQAYARKMGYKPGWVWHQAKRRGWKLQRR